MTKKALFLDLDGTLLADDKSVPQENRRAVERVLSDGHCVVISTGRPLASAVLLAQDLNLTGKGNYLIAYNGGILYDIYNKKILYECTIPVDVAVRVFEEAERRDLHIQTYDSENVLVEPRCDNEHVRLYCSKIRMKFKVIPSIGNLDVNPVKLLAIDPDSREKLQSFIDWINSSYADSLSAFFSNYSYVEVVKKGLNKGNALRQMAKVLNVAVSDTIAAGDQANDIDMIRAAGVGCAMSNAEKEVKEAADYITEKDNNRGGVAEIIEKFVL